MEPCNLTNYAQNYPTPARDVKNSTDTAVSNVAIYILNSDAETSSTDMYCKTLCDLNNFHLVKLKNDSPITINKDFLVHGFRLGSKLKLENEYKYITTMLLYRSYVEYEKFYSDRINDKNGYLQNIYEAISNFLKGRGIQFIDELHVTDFFDTTLKSIMKKEDFVKNYNKFHETLKEIESIYAIFKDIRQKPFIKHAFAFLKKAAFDACNNLMDRNIKRVESTEKMHHFEYTKPSKLYQSKFLSMPPSRAVTSLSKDANNDKVSIKFFEWNNDGFYSFDALQRQLMPGSKTLPSPFVNRFKSWFLNNYPHLKFSIRYLDKFIREKENKDLLKNALEDNEIYFHYAEMLEKAGFNFKMKPVMKKICLREFYVELVESNKALEREVKIDDSALGLTPEQKSKFKSISNTIALHDALSLFNNEIYFEEHKLLVKYVNLHKNRNTKELTPAEWYQMLTSGFKKHKHELRHQKVASHKSKKEKHFSIIGNGAESDLMHYIESDRCKERDQNKIVKNWLLSESGMRFFQNYDLFLEFIIYKFDFDLDLSDDEFIEIDKQYLCQPNYNFVIFKEEEKKRMVRYLESGPMNLQSMCVYSNTKSFDKFCSFVKNKYDYDMSDLIFV